MALGVVALHEGVDHGCLGRTLLPYQQHRATIFAGNLKKRNVAFVPLVLRSIEIIRSLCS